MKKRIIISAISSCLFSLALVNSASAQKPKSRVLPAVTITASSLPDGVQRNFARSYNEASNIRWLEIDNRYLVKFDQNDMNHHALYMKGGDLVYHVGYGYEKNLPPDVKKIVSSNYKDYDVNRVFDVYQANRKMWIVNLLDSKSIITAGIEDGDVQEISRIKNASPFSGELTSSMIKLIKKYAKLHD